MKPIERSSKDEVLPFEFFEFIPAEGEINELYAKALAIRDGAQMFFSKNWDNVNKGSVLEETMGQFFDFKVLEAENERIRKSLEFFLQPIGPNGERSGEKVVISNSRPIGREFGLSACDAIAGQRIGGVEIKTLIYRDQKKELKAAIGCGDETNLMPNRSKIMTDEDLESVGLMPFTVNPATIGWIADLKKITLSDKLRGQTGDVSNNLGSRFLSCFADAKEYVKMIDASILPHQKVSPINLQSPLGAVVSGGRSSGSSSSRPL